MNHYPSWKKKRVIISGVESPVIRQLSYGYTNIFFLWHKRNKNSIWRHAKY